MVTNWLPALTRAGLPLYREIADALAADIAAARLEPGTRLPTHRDLAWRLEVTIGTVSRAYAEAERRGLIGGTVGRGTFVLPQRRDWRERGDAPEPDGFVDLSVNYALAGSEGALLADSLTALAARSDLGALLLQQPHAGREEDRAAGAQWLAQCGLAGAVAVRTIVTNGAQHGISVLLSALARPGDLVAVEELTYPGVKAAAQQLGLQLVGVAIDDEGLRPDALDAVCRARPIKLLLTLPTLHNPTTATMPAERRREIAAIARRHDLAVIEDDVYGFLRDPPEAALAGLLPERAFYLSSVSKCFAPGLRIGYVHAPAAAIDRVGAALRASTYMATPLMAAIATRWIRDRTADHLTVEKRRIAASGQRLAATIFSGGGSRLISDPASLHCCLVLPGGWRGEELAAAARRRGVGVTPVTAFAVGSGAAFPEAVRFCLGTVADPAVLERALRTLAELVASEAGPYLSVV